MRSRAPVALVALLLLLPPPLARSMYTSKDAVERLDQQAFDDEVIGSDALWLVEFYAPWCGHCQKLAPHWKAAAQELRDGLGDAQVRLGAVDCTQANALCSRFKVDGYPTVKVFDPKDESPGGREASFGRDKNAIIQYAHGKLGVKYTPPAASGGPSDEVRAAGGGAGSASLVTQWETTTLDKLQASALHTVAYAVALFAPKPKDNPLVLHVLETAPSRVAAPEFDWAPLGPLLAAAGHPCAQIQIVLVSPHIEQRLHATTRVFHQAHGADCGPVTLRYHKNFYDNSAELRPLPAGATEAEAAAGGRDKADMVVWLNVDAYMCPWRYSVFHALGTGVPVAFSLYDEPLAQTMKSLVTEAFEESFSPHQEEVCDKMSQKLYNFKWLAHKVGQNWTKLRSTVDPESVDVYLPPAPNLFAAEDKAAPRWTDPKTLVTRTLTVNAFLLGVWNDREGKGIGARSAVKRPRRPQDNPAAAAAGERRRQQLLTGEGEEPGVLKGEL